MAVLPEAKRVLLEDIPDAPSWFDKVLYPLNSLIDYVTAALNKQLNYADNFNAQIKEIKFQTLPTYSGGDFTPISFLTTMSTKPEGLFLMRIYEKTDSYTPIQEAVYVNWIEKNGTVTIDFVTGLQDSKVYIMKVLVT